MKIFRITESNDDCGCEVVIAVCMWLMGTPEAALKEWEHLKSECMDEYRRLTGTPTLSEKYCFVLWLKDRGYVRPLEPDEVALSLYLYSGKQFGSISTKDCFVAEADRIKGPWHMLDA